MNKNLQPGSLTKFIIPIGSGEYEPIFAIFIERKLSETFLDTLIFYIPKYNKLYKTALTPIGLTIIENQ